MTLVTPVLSRGRWLVSGGRVGSRVAIVEQPGADALAVVVCIDPGVSVEQFTGQGALVALGLAVACVSGSS